MIIIIEGPDGAGKSTLAEQLSKQTGYPIEHRSKPETAEEKRRMYADYKRIANSSRNVILDRCWYSEMVYGKVMRDQSYITHEEMLELEEAIAKNGGGVIIHCTDGHGALWKRCQKRGEDYIKDIDTLLKICEEYDDLMTCEHKIPVVHYGFDSN